MSGLEYYVRIDEIENGIKVDIPKNVLTGMDGVVIEYVCGEDLIMVDTDKKSLNIPVEKKYHHAAILLSLMSQFYPRNLSFDLVRCFNKKGKPLKKLPIKKSRQSAVFLKKISECADEFLEFGDGYDFIDYCSEVY